MELIDALVGRFPLFRSHAGDDFREKDCKELPSKLVLEEAPTAESRLRDVQTQN